MTDATRFPKLRPIEAFPTGQDGQRMIVIHDPAGLAAGQIVLSGAALFLLSLMDGQHTLPRIAAEFRAAFGQPVALAELQEMVQQLEAARFLDSDAFRAHFQSLVDNYRTGPARISVDHDGYGLGEDGLARGFNTLLARCDVSIVQDKSRRLAGLIAPHLDYPRGTPCYADAYGLLATTPPAKRYVILGTNHFGRATGPVATSKDFKTPLGTTTTDREFLQGLNDALAIDLCEHEFDHQREHSVELQVLLLQHLLGPSNFKIVPVLCHDPCGPNRTGSYDGKGADLHQFAVALGQLIRDDPQETIIIAGADLSHIGRRFGDERDLESSFMTQVETHDRNALHELVNAPDAEPFVDSLRARQNNTRVCSAGCIYALRTALPAARVELLRYHQAVNPEVDTAVTCCAAALWE